MCVFFFLEGEGGRGEEGVDTDGMAATRPELPDALLFLKQVR